MSPPTAAAADNDSRGRIVLLAGSATTLLALAGVFTAAHHGVNVMGWYANYVLPAGALLVGACAASGYGIAGWMTGLKMTPKLIVSITLELALSYLVAHYSEYREQVGDGSLAGFFSWFDATTRAFAWDDHGHLGEPLGLLGYGLRALELAGFLSGGALVPITLRKKPYCEPCRIYKRSTLVGAVPWAGVQGPAGEPLTIEQNMEAIFGAARDGDRARLAGEIAARGPLSRKRKTLRQKARVLVRLQRCPRCADGALVAMLLTGHGRGQRTKLLRALPLESEKVVMLFG